MTDAFERLAADRVYEFDYFLTKNAIRGTVAGTALRPLAMRRSDNKACRQAPGCA